MDFLDEFHNNQLAPSNNVPLVLEHTFLERNKL